MVITPKLLIALLLCLSLLGFASCASKVSVFDSSSCSAENLIGYVWYPAPKFTELVAVSCTSAANGQYYTVTPNLPEETLADRRTDWMWWYTQVGVNVENTGISSCDELTDQNAIIKGAPPNTCINYPSRSGQITAYSMTYCTNNVSLVADVAGGSTTCGTNRFPASPECVGDPGGFYDKIVCLGTSVSPSGSVASPISAPVEAPINAPISTNGPISTNVPINGDVPMMGPFAQPTMAVPVANPSTTPKATISMAFDIKMADWSIIFCPIILAAQLCI